MDRDYQAEFRQFVDERTPAGDYVLPVLVSKIVNELWETNPFLLQGWLASNAEQLVARYLSDLERQRRAQAVSDGPRAAFAEASGRFQAGDREAMSPFRIHLVVDSENTRRPVGEMTKTDHQFVAGRHEKRSQSALFEAAFHRAIARKIPKGKTTADVFSEEQYLAMRASIR